MRPSRLLAAGTAAAVAGLPVAGCGTHAVTRSSHTPAAHGPGVTTVFSRSKRPGVLYGQVMRRPGLDPRSAAAVKPGTPISFRGPLVPVNGDEVDVHDARGRAVAIVFSKKPDGTFRFTLPPGTYRVVDGICDVGRRVSVASGTSTHLILKIPNAC